MAERRGEAEIKDWLQKNVSVLLGRPHGDIDPARDLRSYGLSSMAAVGLAGELEDWLGYRVDPALLIEHHTIDAITRQVAKGPS